MKIAQNSRKLSKTRENCAKLGKTRQNWAKLGKINLGSFYFTINFGLRAVRRGENIVDLEKSEKCAYSRYRSRSYSPEGASQNFVLITSD